MNKEDCEQRLNKIRETNRKAQKKYYDNPENKQKKVEKQRERRALKREQCKQFNEAQSQPVCTQQPKPKPEPEPVCTQQLKTKTIPKTLEEIIDSLEGKFTSKKSEETYRSGVKRLFHLGECSNNIIVCLKKPKSIIDKIQNGMNKDKPYSISAKKGVFQTILWLLDNILTAESGAFTQPMWAKLKKTYKDQFDLTKTKSYVEHENTQQTEVVPTFEEYLNRLREKYNNTDKESILPRLYSLFTVRDNFAGMKIITSLNDDDYINNFMYIPRSGFIKIIINKYKTKSGDSRLIFSLNNKIPEQKQLSIDIKTYVKNNNLFEGNYIFGKTSLSLFISKINKSIGFNGGINLFRHMRASEGATSDYTERHLLSKQMGHSIATSAKYVRKINK